MKTRFSGRGKVAIVGFAQSEVSRRGSVPLGSLTLEACARAIEDAGLQREQIDGLSTGPMMPAFGEHTNIEGVDTVTCRFVAEYLGNPSALVQQLFRHRADQQLGHHGRQRPRRRWLRLRPAPPFSAQPSRDAITAAPI